MIANSVFYKGRHWCIQYYNANNSYYMFCFVFFSTLEVNTHVWNKHFESKISKYLYYLSVCSKSTPLIFKKWCYFFQYSFWGPNKTCRENCVPFLSIYGNKSVQYSIITCHSSLKIKVASYLSSSTFVWRKS